MGHQITVRERTFDVQFPPLDVREDLVYSYGSKWRSNKAGMPLVRVCAAALGQCCPEVAFGLSGVGASPRDDIFAYGSEVYIALRDKGWTGADVLSAGSQLVAILVPETFPRESEVEAAVGNSEGGGTSA